MSAPRPDLALLARGGFGGSTRVALRQARLAAARGQRVELFCEQPLPEDLHPASLPVHAWGTDPWPTAAGRTADDALLERLLERHRSRPFALLHAHFAVPHGDLALRFATLSRQLGLQAPAVAVTLHGSDVLGAAPGTELAQETGDRWAVRRAALRRATDGASLSVPSASLRARLEALDITSKEIEIATNFLLEEEFDPVAAHAEPAALRVLHAGALRQVKRPQSALRAALAAAAELAGGPRDLRLELLGEGPELGACEHLLSAAGDLAQGMRIAPAAPLDAERWARTDALLLASRYESCSLVALEAMARGRPVIAPAVGGLAELLGTEAEARAWPLEPDLDGPALEAALAGALVHAARNPEEAAARGRRAREYALARHGPRAGAEAMDRIAERALDA